MKRRCFALAWLLSLQVAFGGNPGFYRLPALHGETVVFTAEGDLWKVSLHGGAAQRLTSHPGLESHAAFSPDGTQVAFSAQYEGPTEVYVMPVAGGLPQRLTWHGEGARVAGWTRDGRVLYSTKAFSTLPNDQLVAVDPATGAEAVLPLAQADQGVFDDTGKLLFFTRLPFQGSSTHRYQGGTAQHLWRYDDGAAEAVPLTADFAGTSKNPLWWQGRVYFISDRSGVMNLWSMNPDGGDARAVTAHEDFDVAWATLHEGRLVYQHGADLRVFTLDGAKDEPLAISLTSDFDQTRERWVAKPLDYLTRASLSPDGDRLVLTARGDVFVAPTAPGGRWVTAPRPPGARYRDAIFFPDGKSVLALTDETGEIEAKRLPADGLGPGELLSRDGTIFRFDHTLSPDGQRLAWQDKSRQLWVRELATGTARLVATAPYDDFNDLAWSPDGQWLAFVETGANTYRQIKLFHPATGTLDTITSERVNSFSPAWSRDGQWLYFLSERDLRSLVRSPWGDRQPEPFFTEVTKLYALALRREAPRFPFDPPDELHPAPPEKKKDDPPANGGGPPSWPVLIDRDGLAARLRELPVPAGNYDRLTAAPKHLFFAEKPTGFGAKTKVKRLEIKAREVEVKTFAEDVSHWELSANGAKILLRQGEAFHIVPADGDAPAKKEKPVSLAGWTFSFTPHEEWRQIYHEAWRMLRDYFYDAALHGVDWPAVRQKYEPLVERVADREDLHEVLHGMSGELSALHTYVRHGDKREGPDQITPSSLGASLERDETAGGWRVARLFRTDPDYPAQLGPLLQPGVEVGEGDVITQINGASTLSGTPPGPWLRGQAGKSVRLEIKPRESATPRSVLVTPLTPEQARDLRYSAWEYSRRLEAERLGEGDIGYVHLRAMGADNIAEWARDFYPVFHRQGLIIDVRHNRGGNIDSWILEKLLRKAWFYWSRRTGSPYWNMQYAFRGHVVVLCNERTASDGEAFAEGFRRLGLGKVIGTRTWGGEIWLSAQRWLVDKGMCSAAESGVYGPEGAWLIEGHGVDPDLVVDNPPHATFQGRDLQLEAAVAHLKELIRQDPRPVPPPPPKPDKSR